MFVVFWGVATQSYTFVLWFHRVPQRAFWCVLPILLRSCSFQSRFLVSRTGWPDSDGERDVMYCLRGGACIAALHVMSSNATSCYLWKARFMVGMWCSICAADIYIQVCIRECMWVCSYEVPQVQLQLNLHHGAPQWNTLFIPNFVFSGTRVQNPVAGEGPSSSWVKPLLTRQLAENSVKRWTKIKMSKGFSFDNVTCTMLMLGIVCSQ